MTEVMQIELMQTERIAGNKQSMPRCNNCGSEKATYGGLQWFPLVVLQTEFDDAHLITDPDRPNFGALLTYTCDSCHTTYLLPPTNVNDAT